MCAGPVVGGGGGTGYLPTPAWQHWAPCKFCKWAFQPEKPAPPLILPIATHHLTVTCHLTFTEKNSPRGSQESKSY